MRTSGSQLALHIPDIVCLCTKKEMLRPTTSRVVALMQDVEYSRVAVKEHPNETVGVHRRLIASGPNHAISVIVEGALPQPTLIFE